MAIDLDALDRDYDNGTLVNRMYRAVDGEHGVRDLPGPPRGDGMIHTGPDVFIEVRPKADRYVYVLLRDLTRLDADAGAAGHTWYEANRPTMTVANGSKWIDRLKAKIASYAGLPVVAPAPVTTPLPAPGKMAYDAYQDIVDGNYAIQADGQKTHFYRVSRKEGKGQYAGRTFLNVQERASDGLFKIYNWGTRQQILTAIRTAGPEASRLMFSARLGRCWNCYKSLTDEDNPYKIHGLGPDCGPEVMGGL